MISSLQSSHHSSNRCKHSINKFHPSSLKNHPNSSTHRNSSDLNSTTSTHNQLPIFSKTVRTIYVMSDDGLIANKFTASENINLIHSVMFTPFMRSTASIHDDVFGNQNH